MTTQPEALKLADECDEHMVDFADVANELRRMYESNQELVAALKEAFDVCIWPSAALSGVYEQAAKAIAKAERTTT